MYLIDSDVLIDAKNRHYAFDIVPAFWEWLIAEHHNGKVFVVQRVYDEVVAGADELAEWIKSQPASLKIAPSSDDQPSFVTVTQWASTQGYKPAAISEFLQAADYFNIAQALTRSFTVVTQERPESA